MSSELEKLKVREPAVSGAFYPSSESELKKMINSFLDEADVEMNGKAKALILPHAGYVYSGQTVAFGIKAIKKSEFNKIILLGPSHYSRFEGVSVMDATHYKTPLGFVKISQQIGKIKKRLEKENLLHLEEAAHSTEHALEVELPFLQSIKKDFELVPLVIGPGTTFEDSKKIADIIKEFIDDETIVVVSTDFTHYGPRFMFTPFENNIEENIENLDRGAFEQIKNLSPGGFYDYVTKTGATICGRMPVTILLFMLEDSQIAPVLLHYETSGKKTGDYDNCVSYASFAFFEGG